MKRKLTLGLCLLVACSLPALAVLGVGDIVYDPTSFAELVKQFVEMQQQYSQMMRTYQMIQNQYNQMLFMAQPVPVNMLLRYGTAGTPWLNSSATNVFGTSGGWTTGINTGLGVPSGYSVATVGLGTYGGALGGLPSGQMSRLAANYATVELTDGANQAGMETIGRIRANAPAVESTIQNLQSDSLSSDPEMNTEIGVLNKINAANVVGLRNTQDTNKLLASLAEERLIEAKRERDAEAQAFNEHIQFMTQGQQVMTSQSANASAAMMAWRMP
jgi:hypothetical protein